jgi:histone H3/H4
MPLSFQASKSALKTNKGLKVSDDAALKFHDEYLTWARKIAQEATAIAISNNRHTVLDRDVELAVTRVAKRESA